MNNHGYNVLIFRSMQIYLPFYAQLTPLLLINSLLLSSTIFSIIQISCLKAES